MRPRTLAGVALLCASLSTGAASAQYRLRADGYFAAAGPVSVAREAIEPAGVRELLPA
jgi:hypothetical protein